mgnify:CR=1 FL=1
MRGKVQLVIFAGVVHGITPAYAGKRSAAYCLGVRVEDHPRLCGEKLTVQLYRFAVHGSPPPMRGKAPELPLVTSITRITPAYAGKSSERQSEADESKDHPRLCGEKVKFTKK